MSINIGLLNEVIHFYKDEVLVNDSGFQEENLILDFSTRCKVDNITGKEIYKLDKINSIEFKKFTIRYNSNITNDHKIRFSNKLYDIYYIDDIDNKHRFLEVYGKEITNYKWR